MRKTGRQAAFASSCAYQRESKKIRPRLVLLIIAVPAVESSMTAKPVTGWYGRVREWRFSDTVAGFR